MASDGCLHTKNWSKIHLRLPSACRRSDKHKLLQLEPIFMPISYRYCWSICAFSMRLSFARRFWNHILICVSLSCNRSANSHRRLREMYSFRWNSNSNRSVCSLLNVVRCLLGRFSRRRRRATNDRKRNKISSQLIGHLSC